MRSQSSLSPAIVAAFAIAIAFSIGASSPHPVADSGGPYAPSEPGRVLDPLTWLSPSGELALLVDPSERRGSGPAQYRMTRGGLVVWEGERAFSLQQAIVTDDGLAYGYAYTDGSMSARGTLDVIRLERDGTAVVLSQRNRRSPSAPHGFPEPICTDLWLDLEEDALMTAIHADHGFRALGGTEVHARASGERPAASAGAGTSKRAVLRPRAAEMPRTPVVPRRTVELALVGQIGIATFPAEPGAPSLGDIDALALDPECRLYALDRLTLRVHVFDPEGRQQRVCVPTLEDVVMLDEIARLSIGLDRSVFVSTHRRTIEFAPDGERRGVVGLGTDDAGRDLLVDPRNGDRWQIGYNALHRLGEDGQRTQTIRRRPDRRWLRRPDDACVADDGSIFVADRFEQSEAVEIHRYGRAGEPLQTFVVPSGFIGIGQSMASSQRWLVATVARGFELFDLVDGDVLFFERKARSKGLVQPMLGADGTELWLADLDGRTIYRHFLPESNR